MNSPDARISSHRFGAVVALVTTFAFAAALIAGADAADWPQFRGPSASGVAEAGRPPVEWSPEKNIAWRADLPGAGFSQPVVVGDRVYVTGSSGAHSERLHVVCFDAATGAERWLRTYWATGRTVVPADMRVATPTPMASADRVYALFSSNDLACLDRDGNLLWFRGLSYDYPNATNNLGMASSPVLVGETLVCQLETDDASFAIGLDASTGENRWKIDRLRKANWTSPVAMEQDGKPIVLLEGADGVQAVAPATGATLWKFADGGSTVSSVSVADGVVFVPANGVAAIRPPAAGSNPETLWNNPKLRCSFVSPVVYRDRVYAINDAGVLACGDAATGELLWQLRLGGSYWGTPSAADRRLYCPSKEGIVKVVDLTGQKGKIVAENELGEPLFCPPAIVGDALYLRTDTTLWKVRQP